MTAATTYRHIVKEPGQAARLEKHPRLRVSMIVSHYLAYGRSADEICLHLPHVSPGEVYSALAYYFDHREEIDAEIREELDRLELEAKTQAPSPIWRKLKAKGLI